MWKYVRSMRSAGLVAVLRHMNYDPKIEKSTIVMYHSGSTVSRASRAYLNTKYAFILARSGHDLSQAADSLSRTLACEEAPSATLRLFNPSSITRSINP
jgi:hypothetical protein